jgi:hypothetical protein
MLLLALSSPLDWGDPGTLVALGNPLDLPNLGVLLALYGDDPRSLLTVGS